LKDEAGFEDHGSKSVLDSHTKKGVTVVAEVSGLPFFKLFNLINKK
jgi:hypothetical protein